MRNRILIFAVLALTVTLLAAAVAGWTWDDRAVANVSVLTNS